MQRCPLAQGTGCLPAVRQLLRERDRGWQAQMVPRGLGRLDLWHQALGKPHRVRPQHLGSDTGWMLRLRHG